MTIRRTQTKHPIRHHLPTKPPPAKSNSSAQSLATYITFIDHTRDQLRMSRRSHESGDDMRRNARQDIHAENEAERDEAERKHLALLQRLEHNYQVAFSRLATDYQGALDRLGTAHQATLDRLTAEHEEQTAEIVARQEAQSRELEGAFSDALSSQDALPSSSAGALSAVTRKRDRVKSASPASHSRPEKRERSSPSEGREGGEEHAAGPTDASQAAGPTEQVQDQENATASSLTDLDYAFANHVLAKLKPPGPPAQRGSEAPDGADDPRRDETDTVAHPLTVRTIRARLMNNRYASLEEFKADLDQIIDQIGQASTSSTSNNPAGESVDNTFSADFHQPPARS